MNILSWLLFGLIAGVIANAVDPAPNQGGTLGAILLGVAGAVVGGYLSTLLFGVGVSGFNITSFIISVGGALALLFVGRMLRRA